MSVFDISALPFSGQIVCNRGQFRTIRRSKNSQFVFRASARSVAQSLEHYPNSAVQMLLKVPSHGHLPPSLARYFLHRLLHRRRQFLSTR